jgi:hypothetical protein
MRVFLADKTSNLVSSLLIRPVLSRCGGMVDAVDSKSTLGNQVLVRVRPSASFIFNYCKLQFLK